MGGVFICYRRDDSAGWTGRIYDRLVSRLGDDAVFMDVEAIGAGDEFPQVIDRVLDEVDSMVVVIGQRWLDARGGGDTRRLDDPADYVRQEILGAIERDLRIVPVLVDSVTMPDEHDLPEMLGPLARRSAVSVSDTRFEYDVRRLLEALQPASEHSRTQASKSRRAAALGLSTVMLVGAAVWAQRYLDSDEPDIGASIPAGPLAAPSTPRPEPTSTTVASSGEMVLRDPTDRTSTGRWPTLGGDQQRTGVTGASGLPEKPNGYYWRISLGEGGHSSPIFSGDLVIVGGAAHVHFLDASTGDSWAIPVAGPVRSTPTAVDDTVYFGTDFGWIYAVSASWSDDDPERWRFQTGGPVTGSPAVVDQVEGTVTECPGVGPCVVGDIVIAGSTDGYIYAINSRDRGLVETPLWQYPQATEPPGAPVTASPALWTDYVFVGDSDGYLYKIRSADGIGEQCARVAEPISYLAVAEGILHIGSGFEMLTEPAGVSYPSVSRQAPAGRIESYDAESCDWMGTTISSGRPRGLGVDTTQDLLVTTAGGVLEAWPIGEKGYAWRPLLIPGVPSTAPALASGIVYFGATDGLLYAVDTASGTTLWEYQLEGPVSSTPLIGDNVVYVIDGASVLHALGSSQATSQ